MSKMVNRKLRQWLLPIGVILLTLLIVAFLLLTKQQPAYKAAKPKAWLVDTIILTPDDYTPRLKLYGKVESRFITNVESVLSADVTKSNISEGVMVKKGDVLVLLDDREVKFLLNQREADVKELQAKIRSEKLKYTSDKKMLNHEKDLVELAKVSVDRMQHLKKSRAASAAQLDDETEEYNRRMMQYTTRELQVSDFENRLATLEANLQKAKALLADITFDLNKTTVVAPYDGRINQVMVEEGDRVQPGERLFQIYSHTRLEIRAQIPINYMKRINHALAEGLTLRAWADVDDEEIPLALDRLGGQIQSGRAGIDGIFNLANQVDTSKLTVGRTVEVLIGLDTQENVYAVPITAIYGSNRLYIVQDSKLKVIIVDRLGATDSKLEVAGKYLEGVIIRSPELKANDEILISQLPNAVSGLQVKPMRLIEQAQEANTQHADQ